VNARVEIPRKLEVRQSSASTPNASEDCLFLEWVHVSEMQSIFTKVVAATVFIRRVRLGVFPWSSGFTAEATPLEEHPSSMAETLSQRLVVE
jgi:hypothetical protein